MAVARKRRNKQRENTQITNEELRKRSVRNCLGTKSNTRNAKKPEIYRDFHLEKQT